MSTAVPRTMKRIPDNLPARLSLAVLLIGALCLLWWSVTARTDAIVKTRNMLTKVYEQVQTLSGLEERWSAERIAELGRRDQSAQRLLLAGVDRLALWIDEAEARARASGFEVESSVGAPRTGPMDQVVLVPLTMKLSSLRAGEAYNQSIRLIAEMTERGPRVELDRLAVFGSGGGAERIELELTIWVSANE